MPLWGRQELAYGELSKEKGLRVASSLPEFAVSLLRQHVLGVSNLVGTLNLLHVSNFVERVGLSGRRTGGSHSDVVVGTVETSWINRDTRSHFRFEGPGLNRSVDLLQICDAGVDLAVFTGFDEVRHRDRGQQSNDGHYDHDFNQCEPRLPSHVNFHLLTFLTRGVNKGRGRLI